MKPKKYFSLEQNGTEADVVIYGDVTSWPWLESDVSAYSLSKQLQELDVDTINVKINSYGGEVAEGLAIYNTLRNSKAKVRTECDGFACSIASVIFMAGDERVMNDASLLMIHNAWISACGNASELRKAADDAEKVNEQSIKAYMSRVSIEEDELRALMDAETFLDADEAIKMGFATSKVESKDDKPSQSARKKVLQMLKNPYKQLDDPDDPENKRRRGPQDPDEGGEGTDGGEGTGEAGDSGQDGPDAPDGGEGTENGGESGENTDNSGENGKNDDENDKKDDENGQNGEKNAKQAAFFRAISAI